ncbi:MAG: aspartate-semialdehyde dehydrogenase [Chlamydiota bacterium]
MATIDPTFSNKEKKISVAILGATGTVGQKFVELLADHPYFEVVALAASPRSTGKKYEQAVQWIQTAPIPPKVASMELQECLPNLPAKLVFSGLDSNVAGDIESNFASAGYLVVSNAKNHRFSPGVPLLIPEVNPHHLDSLGYQEWPEGKIITNPNCAVTGLALALKPLVDKFGVEAVQVVTMQGISGAGLPGVPAIQIIDNIIPYIAEEEHKIESEAHKILGDITISSQCNRVPVSDGHLECVSVKLKTPAQAEDLTNAWKSFRGRPQKLNLPSAPHQPLHYFSEPSYPQPRFHRTLENGMAVSIGRLRPCSLLDYKFVILSHNTVRGAAGGAILNAELLCNRLGMVKE